MSQAEYLCCIDIGCSNLVTQPIQHLVASDFAKSLGGTVVFYTSEDPDTLANHAILKPRLAAKPAVKGIIFFRLKQFSYGGAFQYAFLEEIIRMGYEVHFARERLSLRTIEQLREAASLLFVSAFAGSDGLGAITDDLVGQAVG